MAYIGNSPENIQRGRRFVYEFKATAGQTVFSGTDLNNQTLDLLEENEMGVYLNGVRLADSDDYTVSGDTLTLLSAASLNDQLTVETQAEIANISSYTRAEADARYINYDGDIVAGDLQISGEVDAGSLIVDTDVLVVDATNNRVGIGTTSPAFVFDIQSGTSDFPLRAMSSDDKAVIIIQDNDTANHIISKDSKMSLGSSSNVVTTNVTISDTGQIGIGTISPGGSLDVTVGSGDVVINKDTMPMITYRNGTGSWYHAGKHPTNNYFVISDGTTGTTNERFVIDSGGNVGIGTTSPSAEIQINDGNVARGHTGKLHLYGSAVNGSIGDVSTEIFFDDETVSGWGGAYIRTVRTIASNAEDSLVFGTSTGGVLGDRMTITSSGNVGIGTTSPSRQLHINNASESNIRLQGGSDYAELRVKDADNAFSFHFGGSEHMRIDSSSNLLVGKTTTSSGTQGILLEGGTGQVVATATSVFPLYANRLSTDGEIARFQKDGSTVGGIGTQGGDLWVGTGNTGAYFWDGSNAIAPWNTSTNTTRDAAIDLGQSGARFKDLYLSGGVYLGGTGSVNYLDDYDEGTWTANLHAPPTGVTNNDATSGLNRYTKIGNFVTVQGKVTLNTNSSNASAFRLSGLPFTTSSGTAITGSCIVRNGANFDFVPYTFSNTTEIHFYQSGTTGNWNQVYYTDIANLEMHFEISYFAA